MKITRSIIMALMAMWLLAACDDNSSTMGNTLIDEQTEIVVDSSFVVTTKSFRNTSVPSRTTNQLLGSLNARQFGSISSDFVTQFMPAAQLDTTGVAVTDIDSVKLFLSFTSQSYTGDSLVPMGFKIYPLTRQLQTPIYSNFNPTDYYDESDCWTPTTKIYTANQLVSDSVAGTYYKNVSVKLPLEFGRKVYNEYINNPSAFATPEAFARFFPGIYVKNTFGSGRIINFYNTSINFYYSKHATYTASDASVRDTVYHNVSTYLGVSPEVISNNILNINLSADLTQRIDRGETLLVAPLGYNASLTLPIKQIIDRYRADGGDLSVINTLTMEIPVEEIANDYSIAPPQNVLLILTKNTTKFFAENQINDDKTSFLASYDPVNRKYYFTGLRGYIMEMLAKDNIAADDMEFSLIPVDVTTENSQIDYYYGTTTTYVTGIQPYVSIPTMCRLLTDKIKLRFTYSKQSINNL
ncbi:MAG: DUF4270 domain-containing protein [Bacteroides sp.]|nr:DUF4270 domain-containing protein [Bacteroides sp.]